MLLKKSMGARSAMIKIESASNPKFRSWEALLTSKGLKDTPEFLVFGDKVTEEILETRPDQVVAELLMDGHQGRAELKKCYTLSRELFAVLDVFGTKKPLLVVKQNPIETYAQTMKPKGATLMLPFQDPSNIGAAIRSASAFGCSEIWLPQEASHPFHPKSVRGSSGTVLLPKFVRGPKLQDWLAILADQSIDVFGLDMNGTPLNEVKFSKDFVLVAGEEGKGLPATGNLKKISIPMSSNVESLNAATSIGIALYEQMVRALLF